MGPYSDHRITNKLKICSEQVRAQTICSFYHPLLVATLADKPNRVRISIEIHTVCYFVVKYYRTAGPISIKVTFYKRQIKYQLFDLERVEILVAVMPFSYFYHSLMIRKLSRLLDIMPCNWFLRRV